MRELLEKQPPFTPWQDVFSALGTPSFREKATGRTVAEGELHLRVAPAREIAWDRDNAIVSYPPSFVGTCQSVVTLYPQPPKRVTFEAGGEAIGHGFPNADFLIMPSERKLAVIEDPSDLHQRFPICRAAAVGASHASVLTVVESFAADHEAHEVADRVVDEPVGVPQPSPTDCGPCNR